MNNAVYVYETTQRKADIKREIKEKLIDPFRETGCSDSESMKLAKPIAKKYGITLEELFEIYWDILIKEA